MANNNKSSPPGRSLVSRTFRVAIFAALVKVMQPRLWPWGLAEPWTDRMEYSLVDVSNDSLQIKHGRVKKIYERLDDGQIDPLMKGPETVIFDNNGGMYIMNEEGFLVLLYDFEADKEDNVVIWAKSRVVADLGMGRPLGGCFAPDNSLYIADAHLGLIRLGNLNSKVELVASRVRYQGNWSQILYANDVAIGPKTGLLYFTDSSNIAPARIETHSWDTMYGAKVDLIRGSRTGRLLRYDPISDDVSVLATGFHFANGVSIDKDEKWVIFVETGTLRMQKYDIVTGTVHPVVDGGLTGYPDGLDCARNGVTSVDSNMCYAVIVSAIVPIVKLAKALPHPFDMLLRSLILSLPKRLAPPLKTYGGIAVFDPDGGNGSVELIQDPKGTDIGMLTGVTVHDNKLYLGSLKNDYIAVYNLDPTSGTG